MTLTEAIETEKQLRNETLTVNRIDYAGAKGFIEGYKAALESDAVIKVLVDYLKRIKKIPDMVDFGSEPISQVDAMCEIADEALALVEGRKG